MSGQGNGHLKQTNGTYDGSRTVDAVCSYPLVKDTVDLVSQNKYTGFFVKTAGSALSTAASYATPVTSKFQDSFNAADKMMAEKVGQVGDYVPLLRTPTGELVGKVTTDAKTYASSAASSAAAVVGSVGEPVRRTASTAYGVVQPYALAADKKLSPVTRAYGQAIETCLPAESESEEDHPSDDVTQTFQLVMLSLRVQRRLSRRVKAQLNSTATYTEQQIRQIQESSALLQRATETVTQLTQRLVDLVESAKKNAYSLKETVPKNTEGLRQAVSNYVPQVPEYVQVRLNPIFAEIQKDVDVYTKATLICRATADQTRPILESVVRSLGVKTN